MARKQSSKPNKISSVRAPKSFDLENSRYLVPAAFVVMLLTLVFMFRDFLFSGMMLYGSDMISAGVYHRAMYVDYLKEFGAVPQWNPHVFGGMPFVDAFHGDIFYPFSMTKFFGSLYFWLGFNQFLHIYAAGIFMFLAARQFKLGRIASLFSAASYMFAAYLVSMVAPGHEGKIYVTALFPLVILFLDRGFQSKPFFNFTMLGLIVGIIIVSPHPQMSYFTLWAVSLYAAYRLIILVIENKSITPALRPAMLTTYAVVLALSLSAIQFYPGYFYTTNYSPRADTKSGWDWATSWSLHEEEAASLLIPEFAGVSSRNTKTYYWGKNVFKDNSESVGLLPIFLALIGLCYSNRRKRWFFGGLAVFALLYALGGTTPAFKLFYNLIPKVKSLRAASMIMFLFSFSIAVLAGMGVQSIIDAVSKRSEKNQKNFNRLLFGLPIFMFILAMLFTVAGRGMIDSWATVFHPGAFTGEVQAGVTRVEVGYMNLPAIQSGAWFGFLFSAAAAACIWMYRARKAGIGILAILLLLPVMDGCRFDQRFIDVFDPKGPFATNPLIEYFKQQPDYFRVLNLSRVVPSTILPQHGVEVVIGYHGNQLRWYDELLGGPGAPNQVNPRFLNLVGAKYILMPQGGRFPADFFGEKPTVEAIRLGQIQVIRNDNAMRRVFLMDKYRVWEDHKAMVNEILKGTEDFSQTVYLESPPTMTIQADTVSGDSAWIIDHQIDSVLIGTQCSHNQLLVLMENDYESWHAYVDGQPAPILRAYGSFRAVEVPAGTSQVLFKYKSERYATGRIVTLLTLLYLLVIMIFHFWKRRGKRAQLEELT